MFVCKIGIYTTMVVSFESNFGFITHSFLLLVYTSLCLHSSTLGVGVACLHLKFLNVVSCFISSVCS